MTKKPWKIDPDDVTWGSSLLWKDDDPFDVTLTPDQDHAKRPLAGAGRSSHRKPRNASETNNCLMLEHVPTGIQVNGRATGYYSRKEQSKLRALLWRELFDVLEAKVAAHLRIPGR